MRVTAPAATTTTTMFQSNIKSMRKLLFVLVIATIFHHVCADDVAIMSQLAKAIIPTPAGWSGNTPCIWPGVECDSSGRVTSITIVSKSVSGELPSALNQLSSLKTLNLQRNMFSGSLPPLSNLASLQEVYLDDNNFTSIPSDFLSGLTGLQTFSISDNPGLPPWTIPKTLEDSTALVSFIASRANIMGTIPDMFGAFPSLQNLRLSYNNITGSLPSSFQGSGIQRLLLNNQLTGLSGRIDVIGTLSQLTQAWVHVNQLSGPIPDLSRCTSLVDLQLRDNQLTGVIPPSLPNLPKLANVSMQNNNFQGPVPVFSRNIQVNLGTTNSFCNTSPGPCDPQVTTLLQAASALGYPAALADSWKGNDPCDNWDYITCNSGSVTVINFAKQNFVGTISPAIANLTSLKSLILSDNKLTGSIPASLTSLKQLELFDATNNNLSGKVPEFAPGVIVKLSGNPFIGIELPPSSSPGSASNTDPSGNPRNEKKASITVWVVAVIISAVVIIGVLSFIVYKKCVKKQSENYDWVKDRESVKNPGTDYGGSIPTELPSQSSDFQVSDGVSVSIPIDILREVTNNFNTDNILGKGGFGVVYKGQLPDGTRIAVKRMESSLLNKKGQNEFKAEIDVLSKVRHRNLVALHGSCVNGNERLLVYEYMPEGTLEQHLFSCRETGTPPLTWKQRFSIALDVARGVEYLHSLAQQSFIHRDLKPSNILLGDDMTAKVSDFGLVKSAPEGISLRATRLAGTFGYIAPEYSATGRVTTKLDVYAFGVILMELMTGQRVLDNTLPEERSHLVTWFRREAINKDNLRSALDPSVEPDEETFESIWKVAELSVHCTANDPLKRPDMGHAVNVLSPIVVQWTPSSNDAEKSSGIDFQMSLPQLLQRWKANEGNSTTTYNYLFTSEESLAPRSPARRPSEVTSSFS